MAETSGMRPGRRRTRQEILRDRQRMADLDFAGYSHDAIADIITQETGTAITRRQVGYDLERLHEQWSEKEGADDDRKREVAIELRRLDRLEQEAWRSWRATLGVIEKQTVESMYYDTDMEAKKKKKKKEENDSIEDLVEEAFEGMDIGKVLDSAMREGMRKEKVMREVSAGNVAFLNLIHSIQQERRKLKSLYQNKAQVDVVHTIRMKGYRTVSPDDFDDPDIIDGEVVEQKRLPAGRKK